MSKRESVVFQATKVLKIAYEKGYKRSRHADKRNALNNNLSQDEYTKDKIYSQKTYNATKKTCVAFTKYCRAEFGIRYLDEITPGMFKSFIRKGNFKNGKAYDAKTAATYASQVAKLQNVYSKQINKETVFVDTSYKEVIAENSIQKREQMPRDIHDKIINNAYQSKYENGLAFDTSRALGLRVREITNLRKEDFKINEDEKIKEIHIHRSKGGRSRNIEALNLTTDQRKVVEKIYNYFKSKTSSHDRFFTNKADSYSKTFSRIRNKITDKYTHCGIHSMRKEFAKDYYSREIEKGRNELEVRKELTKILGHNRLEVLESYLK
ncbi:hypothetical protein [Clostridium sp. DL1XJH146]